MIESPADGALPKRVGCAAYALAALLACEPATPVPTHVIVMSKPHLRYVYTTQPFANAPEGISRIVRVQNISARQALLLVAAIDCLKPRRIYASPMTVTRTHGAKFLAGEYVLTGAISIGGKITPVVRRISPGERAKMCRGDRRYRKR